MSIREQFNAAASVIRNVPRNGTYQPSEELMLRFYSYYKQATEGPCKISRPAFWQLVKKTRWEAWSKLGDMSQEDAMKRYVEELKGIIETMSYNENVAAFLDRMDLFYESASVENFKINDVITEEKQLLQTDLPLPDDSEETFNAAASVIRNLPKNGTYQPSEELMLKFYSYYKQATEGPCKISKPAFWQLVKKARWEAWSKLENMSQEDAMNHYIEELKGIIETMSYNENVANFLDRIDLFCETEFVDNSIVNADSLEQTQLSHADSSFSDDSGETFLCGDKESIDNSFISSYETCQESYISSDSYFPDTEPDDDFIDSIDYIFDSLQKELLKNYINENQSEFKDFNKKKDIDYETTNNDDNFLQCNDPPKYAKTINNDVNENTEYNNLEQLNLEFVNQIIMTLKKLQDNLDQVVNRIGDIENKMKHAKKMQTKINFDNSLVKS